ncbi:MAG TPA: 3-hydroxyacyl-ACP dehydratase FabZ family protein, partial [Lacipirellulaceae bacterium]|nr:3-hydroxyacyl-ACP dehydratase FabZ family protein [Lacipirellulaceae bacterium]
FSESHKLVSTDIMSLDTIKGAIPHREPFLLLDEIVEQSENRIVCRKHFTGDEFWYRGHYPTFPLTPGVLLCEAAMQAGAVLLAKQILDGQGGVPVVTRMNNVKFKSMVRPGDTVELEVELVERMADAFFMSAKVTADGKTAVTFDFACKMAQTE